MFLKKYFTGWIYMCVYIYTYMCVYIYVCVCIYMYIYRCTDSKIFTDSHSILFADVDADSFIIFLFGLIASDSSSARLLLFLENNIFRDEVLLKVFGINYGNHCIDLCIILNARSVGKGLGNRQRS